MTKEEAIRTLHEGEFITGSEKFLEAFKMALTALEESKVIYDSDELRKIVHECVVIP